MTRAEAILWQALRGKRLDGLKFRRQQVIGPYIADFFCASCRLIVELDGAAHSDEDAQAHDRRRDQWIASQDLRVLRIPNRLVEGDLDGALRTVLRVARGPEQPD